MTARRAALWYFLVAALILWWLACSGCTYRAPVTAGTIVRLTAHDFDRLPTMYGPILYAPMDGPTAYDDCDAAFTVPMGRVDNLTGIAYCVCWHPAHPDARERTRLRILRAYQIRADVLRHLTESPFQ